MDTTSSKGSPLSPEREYDPQLGHTIWELERTLKHGKDSETLRRALIEAHATQLRELEDHAAVPRPQRSFLLLQPRPTEALLLLAGEGAGSDEVLPIAEHFQQRGFSALGTSLSYRNLEQPTHTPHFWQTCADEAENRFDVISLYATRVAVLGVGLGALMALHVASVRRASAALAIFPTLHAGLGWQERLRATVRRLLKRDAKVPAGWQHQRHLAAVDAHEMATKTNVPLFVVVEDRRDRSEAARSAQAAQKLVSRAATEVRVLRPGEAASARNLPPALLDDLLAFVRQH